jgi:predicted enzyme related to lactoylglutathione lyase
MFGSLDFLYVPAADVDRAVEYYVRVLGAELIWKIHDEEAVVAQLRLSETGPALLLADHLAGNVPILIYRVEDLDAAVAALRSRGWQPDGDRFEIPHGPCVTFKDPGGQRFALYQLVRPEADAYLRGRREPRPHGSTPTEA